VLGWRGIDAINKALQSMNLPALSLNKSDIHKYYDNHLSQLNTKLDSAFRLCLANAGFSVVSDTDRYIKVSTPKGQREMTGFSFEISYDPHEVGDDDDTVTFGIHMSGRYFPTYVDWRDSSGGLWEVNLRDAMDMINFAQGTISSEFPVFLTAGVHLKDIFY
jgi:hypothetical protein